MNDSKQRATAIDGLQCVSTSVRRYAEIERIYLHGEDYTLKTEFEAAIMKLYRQILEYEARVACQFNRNTALQIARNIVEADGWENILNSIKERENVCEKLKEMIDVNDQRARMMRLEDSLEKQTSQVDELLQISRKEDEDLLAEIKAMRKDQKELLVQNQ